METEMVSVFEWEQMRDENSTLSLERNRLEKELEDARDRVVQLEEDSEEWVPRADMRELPWLLLRGMVM